MRPSGPHATLVFIKSERSETNIINDIDREIENFVRAIWRPPDIIPDIPLILIGGVPYAITHKSRKSNGITEIGGIFFARW